MRILFIGASGVNAKLRVQALRDLGHEVTVLRYNDLTRFKENTLLRAMRLRAVEWVDRYVSRWLKRQPAMADRYDMAFLNQPKIVGPRCYGLLRARADRIANYINDDPFNHQSVPFWRLLLRTLPLNDVVAVPRDVNVQEAKKLGARKVVRIRFPADETLHCPLTLSEAERRAWASEVVFIGTWFPERGPFIRTLIEAGVPMSIYGNRWKTSPEWPAIAPYFRSEAVYGEDYVKVIQCSKIAIGLLSKANRDQHTTRSNEIPAIGTLLCAERTEEHLAMYREGEEAVFFDDAEECAQQCRELLEDDDRRRRIAEAGHRRFLADGSTNKTMLKTILSAACDESTDALDRSEVTA
jgi:hypothetical protein